ncbi:MAG: hydroxymethylbilane synthase [Pseudomonadota bacterium]
MLNKIRIISRKSELAMCQADMAKKSLLKLYPKITVEITGTTTSGDKFLAKPLATVGGKGLFVKELEQAMLDNRADIAVHSMKDVPVELPKQLCLNVILAREDARDVFVSKRYQRIEDMPANSIIGTSSLRRQSLIKVIHPKLQVNLLRGNVLTRLKKLDNDEYDGIILAAAGLKRLQLTDRIRHYLNETAFIPAVGQGAIGIECRRTDSQLRDLLKKLNDPTTKKCITAERALNQHLQGGCSVPIGGHATINDAQLTLNAFVAYPDGSKIVKGTEQGEASMASEIGKSLAVRLLSMGADKILRDTYREYGH